MNSEPESHECSVDGEQTPINSNIVRYERRVGQPLQLSGGVTASEVIFIDEDTPAPPSVPWIHVPFSRRKSGDGDVIYIGPE